MIEAIKKELLDKDLLIMNLVNHGTMNIVILKY